MKPDFWHDKWEKGDIGFHRMRPNPQLVQHLSLLGLQPDDRIFLPLCGKSLDVGWLAAQGFRVAGAELSSKAVAQLFAELSLSPTITQAGQMTHSATPRIDIFTGDIFNLSAADLGKVSAVFDRAALVALPPPMRAEYAAHLMQITNTAPQLLISFEYDEAQFSGPPFSVDAAEIHRLYSDAYHIRLVETLEVQGGLKGTCPAQETVWFLTPKAK